MRADPKICNLRILRLRQVYQDLIAFLHTSFLGDSSHVVIFQNGLAKLKLKNIIYVIKPKMQYHTTANMIIEGNNKII